MEVPSAGNAGILKYTLTVVEYNTQKNDKKAPGDNFGELYIDVRYKEGRVLSDGQVMFLPDIEPGHMHFNEWQIRKRSSQKLVNYLKIKNRPLDILEIGCGNGWLSSKLASVSNSTVIGLDANEPEIMQAKRVFTNERLQFIRSNFEPQFFKGRKFDIILFAAAIQYFPSFKNAIGDALSCLKNGGEIHIIDSNFYKPTEMVNAAKRTAAYYAELGYPEMAAHYFQHSITALQPFNYKILFNPASLVNRIINKNPFYWILIKH
ncbi:class I SAM-dependent methyltransferase [Mucilaginibacter xinganensis]|uniref:Methyltransferase domain-containing protein n=1 Tax=Mucilaginibacter xinganensis TaxID=1234841 RepID=A0A223NZ65_9SPHI|nr:class I SAM-dependent methyltransferase [Mucilaginibacter xinganensis]ASU35179.1 hypothetical protein MuYL_3294 [Mucilaginibacter xinganensis]